MQISDIVMDIHKDKGLGIALVSQWLVNLIYKWIIKQKTPKPLSFINDSGENFRLGLHSLTYSRHKTQVLVSIIDQPCYYLIVHVSK